MKVALTKDTFIYTYTMTDEGTIRHVTLMSMLNQWVQIALIGWLLPLEEIKGRLQFEQCSAPSQAKVSCTKKDGD